MNWYKALMNRDQMHSHLATRALVATASVGAVAAAAGVSTALAHTPAPSAHAASAPCPAKRITVDGHRGLVRCGRATATMTVDGRTYRYRGGQCTRSGGTLLVEVGTVVMGDARHNGGKPDFNFTISGSAGGGLVAYFGGRRLGAPYNLAVAEPRDQGSFHNELPKPVFHGTWNCHGDIVVVH